MPSADFPELVKHMTMAIYYKKGIGGSRDRRFIAALNLAITKCVEWGHLRKVSMAGPPFVLTVKGSRREQYHQKEGRRKSERFDRHYERIQEGYESGPKKYRVSTNIDDIRETSKERQRASKAYSLMSASEPKSRRKSTSSRATSVASVKKSKRPKMSSVRRAKRA